VFILSNVDRSVRYSFLPSEMTKRSDTHKIDQDCEEIPRHYRPGRDKESVVDPEQLKDPHFAAIRGFIPALDLRLSIERRSGRAAKVVPNPARKPMISER